MRFARGLMIVTYGLVAIAVQTLLYREFVTAFENNDLSVGVFFGSWFLWIGVGAVVVRRWQGLAELLWQRADLLFLLYIPAFLMQFILILRVRDLAGIASYDLVSMQATLFWAMVVNAPVSLLTGALFPVACRWIARTDTLAVSRVYVFETIGSFAGGLAVTVLLAWRVHTVRVSLLLAVVLLITAAVVQWQSRRAVFVALLGMAMLVAAAIVTGTDNRLALCVQEVKWSRLLPREALRGAFQTAHAEYFYGEYGGQWVAMREGSVCEALPGEEEAGRIVATVLCQRPQAKRILVVGSGLALCSRLLILPQMELVAWAYPDIEYAGRLLERLPADFAVKDARFHPVTGEIRRYLNDMRNSFDLVVLNLADAGGTSVNRYFTVEFYEQVKRSLRVDGVVAVGIAGGEDVMGAELVGLGASTRATLARVFLGQVLLPGEQTWLIASDSGTLTSDPVAARDRFAAIESSERVFPPAGLLSVYVPDRTAQATAAYDRANLPERLLVNRDSRPLMYLYSLLLAARQSGASATRFVTLLVLGGWLPFVVPILVFAGLRLWVTKDHRPGTDRSAFDSTMLVFSTGWVAMAMAILLMYLYETQSGSLYLHIGLVSSLFMAGLTAGAVLAGWCVARCSGHRSVHVLLVLALLAHALVLMGFAFGSGGLWVSGGNSRHTLFAVAFVLSGLCCGGYWPVAAAQLAARSLDSADTASRLETADHLGACLGGLAASLLMVPVLGVRISLLVLTGLVLMNLPGAVAGLRRREAIQTSLPDAPLRRVGLALFGVSACVVLGSNLLVHAGNRWRPSLPHDVVSAVARERPTRRTSTTLESDARRVDYVTILDADESPVGYVFSSADFAPDVRGYGGRLNVALHVDVSGNLADLLIVQCNETPSYLDMLPGWLGSLKGRALFCERPLAEVHAVAGATVSSDAILSAVRKSGQRFAAEVLKSGSYDQAAGFRAVDMASLYLVGVCLLAFLAIRRSRPASRIVVLAVTFLVGGIVLNAQYSSEQVVTLLSGDTPRVEMTSVFLLVAGVPVLVLLFGNLYCGYLCPFGAAQELLGYVLPRRFRPSATLTEMRQARFVKYVVLVVLVVGFFLVRNRRTLVADPLTAVFALRAIGSHGSAWVLGIGGAALLGSLFYTRFWCRYLCPAGAFLSLFNHLRLLRRLIPAKRFARCEFGLTATDHLDCLYCDRCRHAPRPQTLNPEPRATHGRPLVWATVVVGLLLAGFSLDRLHDAMPEMLQESTTTVATGGTPRDVDDRQMRTLIEQGRLSDHEAQHYKRVD